MTRNRGARHRRPTNRARAKRLHRKAAQPRSGDLARRVRAAGLGRGDETRERTIDEYRIALARRICMVLNRWRDCRMRICERNRGCMAPGGVCGGMRDTPKAGGEAYARTFAAITQGLKDAYARQEQERQEAEKEAPFAPAKAETRP